MSMLATVMEDSTLVPTNSCSVTGDAATITDGLSVNRVTNTVNC